MDDAFVYWANRDAGTVMKASFDGAAVTTLATGQGDPYVIALDASAVYFTTTTGRIAKVAKDGGVVQDLASESGPVPAIAADADCVYWAGGAPARIMRAPK